jgi:hypothetical protein
MKLGNYLSKEQKQQLNQMAKGHEKLSRKEWEDIMGKNRDIYKRVNGAVRRK